MPALPAALAPFRNAHYASYWTTGLAANFGWQIQMVGAAWLMTLIGGSAEMVGLVQTAVALPVVVLSLLAGALADNIGRRRMILWSQALLLVLSAALALYAYMGWLSPWLLLLFTFLIGCGKALNNPAWQTWVNEIMPREEMPQAIVMNSVGFNLSRTVGPALGGVLVAAAGAFAAFLVNACANLAMILAMLRQPDRRSDSDLPPEPIVRAMWAGLRFVGLSRPILLVIARSCLFNFAAISLMALMPLIARDHLGGDARLYGSLFAAFGIGAVLIAFLGEGLRRKLSLEQRAQCGFASFALAVVMISLTTSLPVVLLAIAVAGASWMITLATFTATVQLSSPKWVVARCQALFHTGSFAGNALGSWVWGALAAQFGLAVALQASAVALVVGVVMGLRYGLSDQDNPDMSTTSAWIPPEIKLDIGLNSGPVITVYEYEIAPEDEAAFLALMALRRRSRYRDGVSDWRLERDMMQPTLWSARYEMPTWGDVLRHHRRRLPSDFAMTAALRSLHKGATAPAPRYLLHRQPVAPDTTVAPVTPDIH